VEIAFNLQISITAKKDDNMTKKWIILSMMMLGSLSVNGQAALLALLFGDKVASENFHMSLDAGVNISSLPGISGQQSIKGFYFGLGTFVKINDQWAITPEFKPLSPRGARNVPALKEYGAVLTDANYEIRLNYIDVPVLIQYSPTKQWFVSAGPQISFLTSAKQLTTGQLLDGSSVDVSQSMNSDFNSMYFSAPIEVGYRLSSAREGKGINLKVRYNIGLSEMIAKTDYGSSNGSTFQVFLSFPFVNVDE
jgi:hypothetical protein